MSCHASPTDHALRAVPDTWIHNAADMLIAQHGADAMTEVARLTLLAITAEERMIMLRVRLAVALQAPPNSTTSCARMEP